MGDSPFLYFSFFASFFLCIFVPFSFKNMFTISLYLCLIALVLKHRKEAEAGSAEEQPARNISGYLSILI